MSFRLIKGGLLLDKKKKFNFLFDGKQYSGFHGDTLASALLANDKTLLGRSFKYHRPRGLVASGVEEPNVLVGLGKGKSFEPNQRATNVELFDGLSAVSQNNWPNLKFDIGSVNSILAPLFSAGFYYKTFIQPRFAWKYFFEPLIRASAGLGRPPVYADTDRYEHFYCHVDVLIVGGGMSGLSAAHQAGLTGANTLVLEQAPFLGGRALVDNENVDGEPIVNWIKKTLSAIKQIKNVTIRNRTMVSGIYDHGYILGYERVSDHNPNRKLVRHRLWKIRAKSVILASGSIERPIVFPGNDVPGVMLASAVRDYIKLYAVSPGDRTVIVTNNDDAYRTALALNSNGLSVPAIIDVREKTDGPLALEAKKLGIKVKNGSGIAGVQGRNCVKSVEICSQSGNGKVNEIIECDVVAMSGGWSPVVHLWSHCGGKLTWDSDSAKFIPNLEYPPCGANGECLVFPVGGAAGFSAGQSCFDSAITTAKKVTENIGLSGKQALNPKVETQDEQKIMPVWLMPAGAGEKLKAKSFLDYQNDVKVSDIKQSVLEGYESVEHTKRYTTLGMATDQGKLSNINGLAILAHHLGESISKVGTTTFRPPYAPISLGAIAGDSRGNLFKPIRKTAIDSWSNDLGAHWELVAEWRRPFTYIQKGETISSSVNREILNARANVGLLDASTLGKIMVKGPDAGQFLDLIYTNIISTLEVGKCRYGLMCNENGFLFDDGVVVRVKDDTFICHTTSGGSDRVFAWMEEWLQTEWWKLKVYVLNVTENFSQFAIVGPKARDVLEKVLGRSLSSDELPFLSMLNSKFKKIEINIYRISFSGELSYEVAIPTKNGLDFWKECIEVGSKYGIQTYGTEALHVMRAEKGFIMIGDETDGTVTPQDLNLHWAVSKKKKDFIGKRAQKRSFLINADRKRLVGLLTQDPNIVLPDGVHAVDWSKSSMEQEIIGHVTSSYFSPTLGRSIALGLIKGGLDRIEDVIQFPVNETRVIKARIVDPVFYDPEGNKQNV